MTEFIGEVLKEGGMPLIKMWNVDIKPGDRPYVRHSHTRFEIMTVNAGSGEYLTEKAAYPILPGDIFVFSSNEAHCITRVGNKGLNITNLHFEPRYLQENSPNAIENLMSFCFSHSPEFQNRIPAEKAGILRENYLMIKEEFMRRESRFPAAVKAYLNLILIELLRKHNYESENFNNRRSNLTNILAVYDYIDGHLDEDLTLGGLASIANLSPNYFSHIFKEMNGVSLWDHITSKRIEKAVNLILSPYSELTMSEVALLCGFNNTVSFNKAFKKLKGVTPSMLKKDPAAIEH